MPISHRLVLVACPWLGGCQTTDATAPTAAEVVMPLPPPSPAPRKLEVFVSRGQSPWLGYTGSAHEEQAGLHVAAASLDPSWERLPYLAEFAVSESPLVAVDRQARRVYVDARYFGDLQRHDVPRMSAGQRAEIGTLKALPPGYTPGKLARFLVTAQLVITYWHLEARLTLESEHDGAGEYRATWAGSHRYCTNRGQDDPERFTIAWDKISGRLSLIAENP